ncbi:MAG: glycosyltransferase [Candidatus Gracilibacteria bacterium]|nr:glycosyltransferase [Candidatus Gracilibacteria bacterium]
MKTLNIITVGYNEELNLSKLYESLKFLDDSFFKLKKIYIDQSSKDKSVEIAKKYNAEIFIHENKGYADPDKKWAVENLCEKSEWCLILDADEEITQELSEEIKKALLDEKFSVYRISIHTLFLNITSGVFLQPRLFKASSVEMKNNIHNYIKIISNEVGSLKGIILNKDLKNNLSEIYSIIEKNNRYTEKEIEGVKIPRYKIILYMFLMPIIWFFGFGIKYRLFFKGMKGFIYCAYMGIYQFNKYTKLYEKNCNN